MAEHEFPRFIVSVAAMRVSFNALLLTGQSAGLGTLTLGLLQGLQAAECLEEVVVLVRPGMCQALHLPRWERCCYHEVPAARTKAGRLAMELVGLPAYDRKFQVDVAYSPTSYLPLNQRRPAVATLVDFCWLRAPETVPFLRRLSLHLRMERSLLRAAGIATISHSMRKDLLARYGARLHQPVRAAPLGVDQRFFRVRDGTTRDPRDRLGIRGSVILASGGTDPRKDVQTLVRGFALLPDALRRNHHVVIIGSADRGSVRLILGKPDGGVQERVVFTGFIPLAEVLEWFSVADLLVYPSLDEGFGLPVLEAMAAGVPVVCSDLEALREVGGDAVSFVPPRSPVILADAMECLLTDRSLREQRIQEGRERARSFTWTACAQESRP